MFLMLDLAEIAVGLLSGAGLAMLVYPVRSY